MINFTGSPSECFSGAYNKRVMQNRYREIAEQCKASKEDRQTVKELVGETVSISEESKDFMAKIAERKSAQKAAREAAAQECSSNVFLGTGDLKQQYLVLSENLYNSGFYDSMSDEEVKNTEELLKQITSGMDSINGISINSEADNGLSHYAAMVDLSSSVSALNCFADKYVPEQMQQSFKDIVKQYEIYNSARTAVHKNMNDLIDESVSSLPLPNAVNVSDSVKKYQEETFARQELGKVQHTKEEEDAFSSTVRDCLDKLVNNEADAASVFDSLKKSFIEFVSGGSSNSKVISMLEARNDSAFGNMADYWSKLTSDALVKSSKENLHNGEILTDFSSMISSKLPSTYGNMKDDGEYERIFQSVTDKAGSLLKAYAESYDEIQKGYASGTRNTYVADESSENGYRKLTMEEELSELDRAYDRLSLEFESQNSSKIISALADHAKKVKEISHGRAKIASSAADDLENRKNEVQKLPSDMRQKLLDASNHFKVQYGQLSSDKIDLPNLLKGINIFGTR